MLQELLHTYDTSRTNPGQPECTFAETLIFNEGWLLRGVLQAWQRSTHPARHSFLPFPAGSKVYSEAQLYTPFKARFQGDKLAEGHTHVDGIVGDFHIPTTKSGAVLMPQWRSLAVFEAKLYSPLSSGTARASGYDQVSRTVACMIHAILESGDIAGHTADLVVLYPADSIKIHPERYAREHVACRIAARARAYRSTDPHGKPSARFFSDWRAVLPRIRIQFLTWEEVVAEIDSEELRRFYDLCIQFNHP